MKDSIKQICIDLKSTILSALKQMDATSRKLLIVAENGLYHSVLSIGDIQRVIIKGVCMDARIESILRSETKVATYSGIKMISEQYSIYCSMSINVREKKI